MFIIIMWWILLNLLPIFNIYLATTAMPHYTVAYRFVFEFIVLGAIPGTNITLDFVDSLVICLIMLIMVLLFISYKEDPLQPSY